MKRRTVVKKECGRHNLVAMQQSPERQPVPAPRAMSAAKVQEITRNGRFADLLGLRETNEVDFKSHAYDCATPRGKRDLVADVVSLANAAGGVLVLGVKTETHPSARIEFATQVLGVQPGLVEAEQYLKVLHGQSAPLVRDVGVEVVESDPDEADRHVLGMIVVPEQAAEEKPFLAERLIDDSDDQVAHAIGWPERTGDFTYWHPLARLQQLVHAGLRLTGLPIQQPREASADLDEDARVADAAAEVDERLPALRLQVVPTGGGSTIPGFFSTFREALGQWHPLRGAGFGFDTAWHPPEIQEERLVATDGGRSFVVSRSGALTLSTALTSYVMRWGAPETQSQLFINPAALTEWVTEALRSAYEVVGPRISPTGWRIGFAAQNLREDKVVAIHIPRAFPVTRSIPTVSDGGRFALDGTGDWSTDGYTVLAEVWGRFFGRDEGEVSGGDVATRRIDLLRFDA